MTDYSLDLYYLCNGDRSGVITHLDDIKFEGNVKEMLYTVFPQFPKSHWQCWWSAKRDGMWHDRNTGLYIRVHYSEVKSQGKWDYWRLWQPWKEWRDTDSYDRAIRTAKKFKTEYRKMKKSRGDVQWLGYQNTS